MVEKLCADTDKTACVDKDLILDILLFLEDPKYPLAADSKSDNCVGCNYACLRFLWVAAVVICGSVTMPGHIKQAVLR